MFGYIKICKPELLVKEYVTYKSVYCGLCRELGKEYGFLSRLCLSYDATFLALLDLSLSNAETTAEKKRCVVNPLKKCCYCIVKDEAYSFSSTVLVLLTYYKLKDNKLDSKPMKRLLYRMLLLLFKGKFKKAYRKYPKLAEITEEYFLSQQKVENSKKTDIDTASKPTSDMMSAVLENIPSAKEEEKPALKQLGFYMGRWIYLLDALDDIDKDKKNGNFNPFLSLRSSDNNLDVKSYAMSVLNFTLARMFENFESLDLNGFYPILKNILGLGLPLCQKNILEKQK